MPENNGVYFLELPGMPVQGTLSEENLIVLHEHRDVHISLSSPENAQYRISSTQTPFYIPEKKKLFTEYTFSSQDNIHAWFSKFDQWTLQIDKQTDQGWKPLSLIDPKEVDGNDYSHLLARPAPIVLDTRPCHTNSQGNADERLPLIQPPQDSTQEQPSSETTLHGQISAANHERLREVRRRALEQSHETFSSLSAKWKQTQWMTREEGMRLCHAYPPEPEYTYLIEILPTTNAFRYWKGIKEGVWKRLKDKYEESMVKDAIFATTGEIADKGRLLDDALRGITYRIDEIVLKNGTVKKFITFKGYAGSRNFLTATRYNINNIKVFTLTASMMSASDLASASASNILSTFSPRSISGKILIVALAYDTLYWYNEGDKDILKLLSTIISTSLSFALANALVVPLTMLIGAIFTTATPAFLITLFVGVCVVGLSIAIGFSFSQIGVTEYIYKSLQFCKNSLKKWEASIDWQ